MNRTYSLKANLPSKMDYTVFIPEEIWIKIASHLSQQELCRKVTSCFIIKIFTKEK